MPFDNKDRCRRHEKCRHFGRDDGVRDIVSHYDADLSTVSEQRRVEDDNEVRSVSLRLQNIENSFYKETEELENDYKRYLEEHAEAKRQAEAIKLQLAQCEEKMEVVVSLRLQAKERMLQQQKQEREDSKDRYHTVLAWRQAEDLARSTEFIAGVKRVLESHEAQQCGKRRCLWAAGKPDSERIAQEIVVCTESAMEGGDEGQRWT
ncbi:hypothetical protein CSUB01_07943 [Colletotrichum sublineola]|uniref:Uncharacterized protein n=1 Tax=Colletotrichum sublineola TaxID=1173701 RepID=A0A066XMQ9_COLSU|nr:hypothetical protein CSUB01_07943 [Colletotrichum sublineola]